MIIFELNITVSAGGDQRSPSYARLKSYLDHEGVVYAESALEVRSDMDAEPPACRDFDEHLFESDAVLKVYFQEADTCAKFRSRLESLFQDSISCFVAKLHEESWLHAWQDVGSEVSLGDFVIKFGKPDGEFKNNSARESNREGHQTVPEPISIYLLNKEAFGTGEHITTKIMLQALQDLEWGQSLKLSGPKRFLDVGTGSGFFAIASELKGFDEVEATELIPEVCTLAVENVRLNHCKASIYCTAELDQVHGSFAVIVCNILPPELFRMLKPMADRLDTHGILLLAGLNKHDTAKLGLVLREARLQWTRTWFHLDWLCCAVTPET